MARVRAVLRRIDSNTVQKYEDKKLKIDFVDMRVFCDGDETKLTRKEFAILAYMAKELGTGSYPSESFGTMCGATVILATLVPWMYISVASAKNLGIVEPA